MKALCFCIHQLVGTECNSLRFSRFEPTAQTRRSCANFWLSADAERRHYLARHVSVIAALLTGLCIAADAAQTRMIPVTERNGAAYVSTTDLERSASIAVKNLPGSDAV